MNLLPWVEKLPTSTLFVGREAESFHLPGGPRVDLRALGPDLLVFRLLLDAHRMSPGRPCSLDQIFAATWPDKQTTGESRRSRVYAVISRLRAMGLAPLLERSATGYHLEPTCCVIAEGALAPRRSPNAVVWNGIVGWRAP